MCAGGHRKLFDRDSKHSFSLQSYSWTLHQDPTNTASKSASFKLKEALLQSVVQKLDCEVGLITCGGQETAKEIKLGIKIVRERFKEIGDSILNFCCELLRV